MAEKLTPTLEQEAAVQVIEEFFRNPDTVGTAAILTGEAGSGKSTVLSFLRERMRGRAVPYLTATTGRAAIMIGGVTVDRLFSINRDNWTVRNRNTLARNMHHCGPNVIIDEASMVGANMARLLSSLAKEYGKRLLLVGDWAQTRPVKDSWPFDVELFTAAPVTSLLENHRQQKGEFLTALNEIRRGQPGELANKLFSSRETEEPPEDDRYVRLYSTNAAVDEYNTKSVIEHAKERNTRLLGFCSDVKDRRPDKLQEKYPLTGPAASKLLADAMLPNGMRFALDCRVMIRRNSPPGSEYSYVNGDTGVLVGVIDTDSSESMETLYASEEPHYMAPKSVTVRLDRTGQEVVLTPHEIDVASPSGGVDYTLTGFPLSLAYAMTIHKVQGATLDRVWVDVDSIGCMPEKHGLLYVALSRARTAEGLLVTGYDPQMAVLEKTTEFLVCREGET